MSYEAFFPALETIEPQQLTEYAGIIKVNMLIDGRKLPPLVKNVLYVQQLECNGTVWRLEDNGMTMKISNGRMTGLKNEAVVSTGRRSDQLLDIALRDVEFGNANKAGAMATKYGDDGLWYRRFSHLEPKSMKAL